MGKGEAFGVAFGDGDLVLPDLVASLPTGLADAEAVALGLGSKVGLGETDGTTTTSGEGVGSGWEVTLSLSQTKYVPNKIMIRIITTIVIFRLKFSSPPRQLGLV